MLYFFCIIIWFNLGIITSGELVKKEEILEYLLNGYQNYLLPQENSWTPIDIKVQLIILGMRPKPGVKLFNHYNIDFLIQQLWYDERLRYNGTRALILSGDFAEQIWRPDTRFFGEKKVFPNKLTENNVQIRIYPNGSVVSSQRCRMVYICKMDFTMFPFDSQTCELRIESYSYSQEYLMFSWMSSDMNGNLKIVDDPNLEEFYWSGFSLHNESFHYKGNGSGTHSHLVVKILLKRPLAFYMMRMYVPLVIVVMISWASFWVDYRSMSARVTLGITTVLTTVELRLKIYKGDAPAGQTLNLYDIYSLICFMFVFTALIEYSFAQSMDIKFRLEDWLKVSQELNSDDDLDYEDTVEQNKSSNSSSSADKPVEKHFKWHEKFSLEYLNYRHSLTREKYHVLDKMSQFIFPITFFVMNFVYIGVVIHYRRMYDGKLETFIPVNVVS